MFSETPTRSSSVGEEPSDRKRKRKTYACHTCHKRKLKCDHSYPSCSRCIKAGLGESCSYDAGAPDAAPRLNQVVGGRRDTPAQGRYPSVMSRRSPARAGDPDAKEPSSGQVVMPTPSSIATPGTRFSDDAVAQLQWQERRIVQLEKSIASLESRASLTSNGEHSLLAQDPTSSPLQASSNEIPSVCSSSEAYKTPFYGPSNSFIPIYQFAELSAFAKAAIEQNPSTGRMHHHLRGLDRKHDEDRYSRKLVKDADLAALLPARSIVTRSVELYFDIVHKLYPVLHQPTILRDIKMFWERPEALKPSLVAILLLVLASVSCFPAEDMTRYVGTTSVPRRSAISWVNAVEEWVRSQSQKHLVLEVFQIYCLLLIAKRTNSIKVKRAWTNAGTTLRFAMAASFHREPSLLNKKLSVFDQEMRRRIWFTILELDLQASIDRGLPASATSFPFNCRGITFGDNEFSGATQRLSEATQKPDYTTQSFVHLAQQSLLLRSSLASIVNDQSFPLEFEDIMSNDRKLHQELASLSKWAGSQEALWSSLPLVALETQLRHLLLLLHWPLAKSADDIGSDNYSKTTCLDAAACILQSYDRFQGCNKAALNLLRNEITRAVLCICQLVATSSARNNFHDQSTNKHFLDLAEKGLKMFEDHVLRLGDGFKFYWYLCVAYGFAVCKTTPTSEEEQRQKAMDRVRSVYYRVIASQDVSIEAPALQGFAPTSNNEPSNTSFAPQNFPNTGLDMFDSQLPVFNNMETSDWTLENLWSFEFSDMFPSGDFAPSHSQEYSK